MRPFQPLAAGEVGFPIPPAIQWLRRLRSLGCGDGAHPFAGAVGVVGGFGLSRGRQRFPASSSESGEDFVGSAESGYDGEESGGESESEIGG